MSFRSRVAPVSLVVAVIISLLPAAPVAARDVTAGVAITDSDAMQELEASGLALSALFSPNWSRGARTEVLNNAEFAGIAPIAALRKVVREEFERYNEGYVDRFPEAEESFGVSTAKTHRKFERNFLDSRSARFHLVGVVNRMDRAYRSPETCGEVRLIYRLAYAIPTSGMKVTRSPGGLFQKIERQGQTTTRSRLPMTINLVLRALPTAASAPGTAAVSCQALAQRWLAAGDSPRRGKDLARMLVQPGGALELIEPSLIDRIETNIQVVRVPSTVAERFGGNAEYLLHIFKWDAGARTLSMTRLENQIDRRALLEDPAKLARLKAWLFTPARLHELADGTIAIPDEFLDVRAITSAPAGTARATNRPFLGLVSDAEAEAAVRDLKAAAARLDPDGRLRNIETGYGLQQRLNDITCTGCHQSRAIGGFHFLGADWTSTIREIPQNAIFIAGSPHFYGDLPRRRGIVEAFAAGRAPDFMRGFSMRPRLSTGRAVKTTFPAEHGKLRDGWGSNCYEKPRSQSEPDMSFRDWTCARGLVCTPLHASAHEPGMGVCLNDDKSFSKLKPGDPFLFGELTHSEIPPASRRTGPHYRFRDDYCAKRDLLNRRTAPPGACLTPVPGRYTSATDPKGPDKAGESYQRGGFFGGMVRTPRCVPPRDRSTICATEAGTGFNACIDLLRDGKTSFYPCLTAVSSPATLRACDASQPCRDDYVCLATKDTPRSKLGACLPPYFLFQFRIDGHPTPPEGPADPI